MSKSITCADGDLSGVRVLAALNGLELFGHERGNIEVFKALRAGGATVAVGISEVNDGGAVGVELQRLGFSTFLVPFGFQWSKAFFRKKPALILRNLLHVVRANGVFATKLREFHPTHVHLGNALTYTFISRAIRRARTPLVVRLGDAPPVRSSSWMMMWRSFVQASIRTVAISRYVWDVSAAVSGELRRRDATIIYNVAPASSETPVSAPLDPAFRHVLYVGQMAHAKGIFDFVKAASLLVPRFHDVRFHLVGGSIHSEPVERKVLSLVTELGLGDRVTLHGWIDNARDYFAKATVHVAPSIWEEPLANVVVEAKREGMPSVVFPSGGLPEMIRNGVDGYICREKTADALAEGIRWVLELSPSQFQKLREEASRGYRASFGEDRFRRAWAEVYLAAESPVS